MKAPAKAFLLGLSGILSWFLAAQTLPPRGGTAAGTPSRTQTRSSPTDTKQPPAATVGHLATRHHVVTVRVGPKGPCYTVRSKDGRLLHKNLTAAELQAKAPALYELMHGAYAGQTTKRAVTLDAAVRVPTALPSDR